MKKSIRKWGLLSLYLCFILSLVACSVEETSTSDSEYTSTQEYVTETANLETNTTNKSPSTASSDTDSVSLDEIPSYSGSPYIVINDNIPFFTDDELTDVSFETYSDLDSLGRCGVALASIGLDLMPTEDRESISSVYPSGWEQAAYDSVDGGYLYNRSHLIGFQLTGENANEENLITGTRSMNVDGMLPFENMVADYISETGNHVYYRVTPIFEGNNLLATGVLMEAKSVEDDGEGILFNVFCYNAQDGISIDYETGESTLGTSISTNSIDATTTSNTTTSTEENEDITYILNVNTLKIHLPECSSVSQMNEENKAETNESLDTLHDQGYEDCKSCNPS